MTRQDKRDHKYANNLVKNIIQKLERDWEFNEINNFHQTLIFVTSCLAYEAAQLLTMHSILCLKNSVEETEKKIEEFSDNLVNSIEEGITLELHCLEETESKRKELEEKHREEINFALKEKFND